MFLGSGLEETLVFEICELWIWVWFLDLTWRRVAIPSVHKEISKCTCFEWEKRENDFEKHILKRFSMLVCNRLLRVLVNCRFWACGY